MALETLYTLYEPYLITKSLQVYVFTVSFKSRELISERHDFHNYDKSFKNARVYTCTQIISMYNSLSEIFEHNLFFPQYGGCHGMLQMKIGSQLPNVFFRIEYLQ